MLIVNNDCVIVAIDFQEKLVGMLEDKSPAIKMSKLVRAAKIMDIPLIVTEQYPKGLGLTINDFCIDENAIVLEKTSFSAFKEDLFREKLFKTKRKTIVIAGIETHICVYQTVIELLDNGYSVYVVADACASRKDFDYQTGLELMKQAGAKITSLEVVLFELLKTSRNSNFKEVQSLIK